MSLSVTNVSDGETVYQRYLLIKGTYTPSSNEISICIKTTGPDGSELFPEQTWPAASGNFKALIMLSPSQNYLQLSHDETYENTLTVEVSYLPLLQNPPLCLVIMIAKDSPLIIDCPPFIDSSAHANLDAVIAKFRITAYMWQAMIAEDVRMKGLGRRTFRLDEEWTADTVSRAFNADYQKSLAHEGAMRSTAKLHIIRSNKTVKQIRDVDIAQNNQNTLWDFFHAALAEAGGPFASSARPVVAGLILDSHYSTTKKLILGHASLGIHDGYAVSLGMFGSHLTYSWPRHMEEIVSCLTNTRAPGATVGNDAGECDSMWEACTIGQGALLHELGHAFDSPHRAGIMERGYSQDWPKNFLSKTAYCMHTRTDGVLVDGSTPNNARWDLSDALRFRVLPQFRLPSDAPFDPQAQYEHCVVDIERNGEEPTPKLRITSPTGIVQVSFDDHIEKVPSLLEPVYELCFTEEQLEQRFDRSELLRLKVVGYNGKENFEENVWEMFRPSRMSSVSCGDFRLRQRPL